MNISDLAKLFSNKLNNIGSSVIIEVPSENLKSKSNLAVENLRNIISSAEELLELLEASDDSCELSEESCDLVDEGTLLASNELSDVWASIYNNLNYSLIKNAQKKYDHINFIPPQSVADTAARGLEYRKKNKGKGGLSSSQAASHGVGSGVVRATSLKNRQKLSPDTVKRMKAFFSRHDKNHGVAPGKKPYEDRGHVAFLLWGGAPGRAWAEKVVNQMLAADRK